METLVLESAARHTSQRVARIQSAAKLFVLSIPTAAKWCGMSLALGRHWSLAIWDQTRPVRRFNAEIRWQETAVSRIPVQRAATLHAAPQCVHSTHSAVNRSGTDHVLRWQGAKDHARVTVQHVEHKELVPVSRRMQRHSANKQVAAALSVEKFSPSAARFRGTSRASNSR